MKRIVIYGTGKYCSFKIQGVNFDEVFAFVDRNAGIYMGKTVYSLDSLMNIEYDELYLFSRHLLEIIPDLIANGVPYEKINPGINICPRAFDELEISGDGFYKVNSDGILCYCISDEVIPINRNEDFEIVKSRIVHENNEIPLRSMDWRPVSKTFGYSRGGSIVRYYIDDFLRRNKECIKGDVLEIGDDHYTKQYISKSGFSYVLTYEKSKSERERWFCGNLINGEGLSDKRFDCIILTQVLNFVEDISKTPDIITHCLKPGGCALITVSGITHICRSDMECYGQYWSFTDMSIRNMFRSNGVDCEVFTYGNLKSSCMFLAGMGCDDISADELDYHDKDYQLVIAAKVTKQ